jgi:hypothetical protein
MCRMEVKIVSIEIDKLKKLIEEVIEEKLKAFQPVTVSASDPDSEFLTISEAVKFLHLSKPTLNKLRKDGKIITIHSTDKRVVFRKGDLIAYLNSANNQSNFNSK